MTWKETSNVRVITSLPLVCTVFQLLVRKFAGLKSSVTHSQRGHCRRSRSQATVFKRVERIGALASHAWKKFTRKIPEEPFLPWKCNQNYPNSRDLVYDACALTFWNTSFLSIFIVCVSERLRQQRSARKTTEAGFRTATFQAWKDPPTTKRRIPSIDRSKSVWKIFICTSS